jgi:hypothetical protein
MERLIFDVTTMRASFHLRHPVLSDFVDEANAGTIQLFLPTVAMAEVETHLHAGVNGWAHLLYGPHVEALDLEQHCALAIGSWPGSLAVRQVAYDAQTVGATVVTLDAALYDGLDVQLLVL